MSNHKTKLCKVSHKQVRDTEAMPGDAIREPILELIKKACPEFTAQDYISIKELKKFRAKHAAEILASDNPKLDKQEQEIVKSIENNEIVSKSPDELEENTTFSQRLADKIAEFGGSWKFICSFGVFIIVWMVVNTALAAKFDPYPFILLNLILSCIAAIQAPVIMMSQNRKEVKDRQRSENDYKINLKAELEIQQLHEKIDLLLIRLSEHQKTKQS